MKRGEEICRGKGKVTKMAKEKRRRMGGDKGRVFLFICKKTATDKVKIGGRREAFQPLLQGTERGKKDERVRNSGLLW